MGWRLYFTGTTTANGASDGTTVIDTSRKEPDGHFNAMLLRITSGSQNGQERTVTSWVKATGTFTVSPAFGGQILSGVTYEVGVTLPWDPGTVTDDNPADSRDSPMPGDLPYVIGFGGKARKLTAEGYIFESGWTKTQLNTSYCAPLRRSRGRKVKLGGSTLYDGDWLLENFQPKESPGFTRSFTYKLVLKQGSDYVVL